MKFIRNADGQLVSSDGWELQSAITNLEAKLDSRLEELGSEGRTNLVLKLRQRWAEVGTSLNSEDEEVLSLFCERVLEFRHLQRHFGSRLVEGWVF